ncbi:hypothetical protein DUNSADRAFT_10212 [Dunaliella salina]|uniref:Uncharacterized protein n=1 Tax=Dunaliella salina TaxID=3046 RepID=A0ABQ7GFW0_DUNSA|nr:hypothetical protein DUNSADRAFT_10212 [Dunaliella salina]|eukprot:KAF5833493.1 hypothetical protein DUNSADRAFT_10212 [Dunaliella salina]
MHPLRQSRSTAYHSNHPCHQGSVFTCKTYPHIRACLLRRAAPTSKHVGQALPEDASSSTGRTNLPLEKTRACFGGASALLPLTVLPCLPHLFLGACDISSEALNALCDGLFEVFGGPSWDDTEHSQLGSDLLEDPASELPTSPIDDENMGRKLEGLFTSVPSLVSLGIQAWALSLSLDAATLSVNANSAVRSMEMTRWFVAGKLLMGMAPQLYVFASAIWQSLTSPKPHNNANKPSFNSSSIANSTPPPPKGESSQQPAGSLGYEGSTGSNTSRQSNQPLTSIAPSIDAMLRLACCFLLCTSLTPPVIISSLCPAALRIAMHALVFGQAMIALLLFKQVCLLAFGKALVLCAQWVQVDGMLHLNDPLWTFFFGRVPLLLVTVSWMVLHAKVLQDLVLPFWSLGLGILFHVICDIKDKIKSLKHK